MIPKTIISGLLAGAFTTTTGCATQSISEIPEALNRNPESFMIVDCLLPPQVRQLGTRITYLAPRRPIKTAASNCEIRGGEYVAYDRANFKSALTVWLPRAQEGDAEAQTYVGEIYEKGLGVTSDYTLAAKWYKQAADQNHSRAQINLGYLYETGIGVERNLTTAMNYYRAASGLTDGDIEYVSSIESANREVAQQESQALASRVSQLQRQLDSAEKRYDEQQRNLASNHQELDSLRAAVNLQRLQVQNAATNQPEATGSTAAILQRISSLEADLETAQSEQKRLTDQLVTQQLETSQLRQRHAASNRDLFDNEAELARSQRQLKKLETQLAEQQDNKQTLQPAIDEAQEQSRQLETEIERLRNTQSASSSQIDTLLQRAEQAELTIGTALDRQADEIAALNAARSAEQRQYQTTIAALQESLASSRDEQIRLSENLASSALAATSAQTENTQIQQELSEANTQMESREAEQKRLQSKLAQLQLVSGTTKQELQATEKALSASGSLLDLSRQELKRITGKLADTQLSARQQALDSEHRLAALELALQEKEVLVQSQQGKLETLQSALSQSRVQITEHDAEKISTVLASGPSIDIISPPVLLTRGMPTLPVRSNQQIELIGKVAPADSLFAFKINGTEQTVNDSGVFRYKHSANEKKLELVAVDQKGISTRLQLDLETTAPTTEAATQDTSRNTSENSTSSPTPRVSLHGLNFGRYYALVIGNDNYQSLSNLNTATNDARAVERVLRDRYGFNTELLLDANRGEILAAISTLQSTLTDQDNLVIYYAGHGELDRDTGRGYWLPVDADAAVSDNWIANSAITDQIDAMHAKHVLVIADSCYSGTLTRSSVAQQLPSMTADQKRRWLDAMTQSKVRTVLSSGGVKPVLDGAPNAVNSVFARVFLDELQANTDVLEVYRLFFNLQQKVSLAAKQLNVDQTPQYAPIRHSGHEAGEFLFVPSNRRSAFNTPASEPYFGRSTVLSSSGGSSS